MEKIAPVQYSATLTVLRRWKGTSHEQFYDDLGFESISSRRWSRCLILLCKIVNNLTPVYMEEPIPPLRQSQYFLRDQDALGRIKARTETFQSSFYPYGISEWNKFEPEIKHAPFIPIFKSRLLSINRSPLKPVFLAFMTQ